MALEPEERSRVEQMHLDYDAYRVQEPVGKQNRTISDIISKRSSYETSVSPDWYLRVLVFRSPDVRARASAIVGIVTRRFMYPLPAQVFAEVNVQAPHTAALRLTALSIKVTHCEAFDIIHKHYI